MNTKRAFTSTQKAEITLSIIKGEFTILETSRKHDIHTSVLNRWKDESMKSFHVLFETKKENKDMDMKVKKYELVISKLTTQNDFLDKVLASI